MENQDNADHDVDAPTDVAYFRENQTAPVRILVSTATHLVPGSSYIERIEFMQNRISQYHWGRDFEENDRFEPYNAEFGFNNRVCYFVLDHGQSPDGGDDTIPILWYRWTGISLVRMTEELPSRIQKRLKRHPFTPPIPVLRPQRPLDAVQRRQDIQAKLCCDVRVSRQDFDFLKENPDHLAWLERNLEPTLWTKFKSLEGKHKESESQVVYE